MEIRFRLRQRLRRIIDSVRCSGEIPESLIVSYTLVVAENHNEFRPFFQGDFNRICFLKANYVWFLCKTNLGRLSLYC
jgi:hypothetical protein